MKMFRRNDLGWRLAGVTIAIMMLLGLMAPGMVLADGGDPLTGTVVITNADGQNVKLRESPSRESTEIARFAEGTEVEIVDGPVAGDDATWYEVEVEDAVGFMDADFLETAPTSPTVTPTTTPETPIGPVSGQATVIENLHVRSGPSMADPIVVTLQAGAVVTLTGGERNGFVSVSAEGGDGWVAREFLVPVGTTPTPTTPVPSTPTATPTSGATTRYVL
ncbi:MAG TPA: SH3 domain-containing protein, partial [Thermomicrobiales bacterium]|nr:SH3 domain-containing protein [Thermomicrobiales bacterium]